MPAFSRLILIALSSFTIVPVTASATTIDFDALPVGLQPSNTFAGDGVSIQTGLLPSSISVGAIVTFSSVENQFEIAAVGATSQPNVAGATGCCVGTKDLLISFSDPVNSVSVSTDLAAPEGAADTVRLIALNPTGNPFEFSVVGFVQALDNFTTAPANLMTVAPGQFFNAVAFQTLTEYEAIDDLTFVPEPSTALLVLAGLVGFSRGRVR